MNYVDVEIFDGYPTPDEEMFTSTAKSSFCYFLDEKILRATLPEPTELFRGESQASGGKEVPHIHKQPRRQADGKNKSMLWRNSARNGNNAVSIYAAENFLAKT
ncbi:MAG: hypothetical protein ACLUKN_06970 [Bacilli bacterium]